MRVLQVLLRLEWHVELRPAGTRAPAPAAPLAACPRCGSSPAAPGPGTGGLGLDSVNGGRRAQQDPGSGREGAGRWMEAQASGSRFMSCHHARGTASERARGAGGGGRGGESCRGPPHSCAPTPHPAALLPTGRRGTASPPPHPSAHVPCPTIGPVSSRAGPGEALGPPPAPAEPRDGLPGRLQTLTPGPCTHPPNPLWLRGWQNIISGGPRAPAD